MKLRHFKLEDGKMVMCDSSFDGEFLHINDVELLLRNHRIYKQNLVDQYENTDVEWQKRCHDVNKQCVYLIDELLGAI